MEGEQPTGTVPGKSTKTSTAAHRKGREPLEESSSDMEVENEGTREPGKEPPQGRSAQAVWCWLSLLSSNLNLPALPDGICSFPFYSVMLKPLANLNCFWNGQKSLQSVTGFGPVQVQKQFVDFLLLKPISEPWSGTLYLRLWYNSRIFQIYRQPMVWDSWNGINVKFIYLTLKMIWLSFSWSSVFSWVPSAELSQKKSERPAAVWLFREPHVQFLKAGIWQVDEYTEIGGRNCCLLEEGIAGAWGKAALLISRGPVCFRNKLPVFAEQPCCHCSFQSLVQRSPNLAQWLWSTPEMWLCTY